MFIYKCSDTRDLIEQYERLRRMSVSMPLESSDFSSGDWYFRGQPDPPAGQAWPLLPSLFRSPGPSRKVAEQFENELIIYLSRMMLERSELPARLVENHDFLLAFAQHYGVRTRMLDWTVDPDVALYHAASEALKCKDVVGCSVFAMTEQYLLGHGRGSHVVRIPHAANPNLAAQRGVLLKCGWEIQDLWNGQQASATTDPHCDVRGNGAIRLVRFDLAAEHVAGAVLSLRARGVDGSTVFPGPHGIARFAGEMAWMHSAGMNP